MKAAPKVGKGHAKILAAARECFCERGYFSVSVEQIAVAAGVSRMTFYRHFTNKQDLASALFRVEADAVTAGFLAIADLDYQDRASVKKWIERCFAVDQGNRRLLRIFSEASADGQEFTLRAQQWITELISGLGKKIPAFAVNSERPEDRKNWLEAWLILYEILDQSHHAAMASGVAEDPLVIELLVDRFMRFVTHR